jgi:hypothetical protein
MRLAAALLAVMCSGCVMGIPDASPPVKPPKPCHVWVRVDNGPWKCYERGEVYRKVLCPMAGGENCGAL